MPPGPRLASTTLPDPDHRPSSATCLPIVGTTRALIDGLRKTDMRQLITIGDASNLEVVPGNRVAEAIGWQKEEPAVPHKDTQTMAVTPAIR